MNARAYSRLVHPVIAGLIAIAYSFIGWIEIRGVMHLPASATWFLTLAVLAPLLCGSLLTGGLHECMHLSFFGVLPGARRSLRRWHCGVLAGIAVVLGGLSLWRTHDTPVEATIGLCAIFLTLPLLNRRGSQSPRRLFSLVGCLLLGCALFDLVGARLYSLAMAAPWAIFAAGLFIAAFCLRVGFDRKRVRGRAGRPFRSAATGISVMFTKHGRMMQAKTVAEAQSRSQRIGRDWPLESVDGSAWDWLRVLLHEHFGQQGRFVWLAGVCVVMAIFAAMPVAISLLIERLAEPGANSAQFCEIVATFGRTGSFPGHSPVMAMLALMFLMPYWIVLVLALTPLPMSRIAYPLSRRRLAWLNFLLSLRMLGVGYAAQVCGVFATVELAGLLAGIPFRFENMQAQAALLLLQLPLLPLLRIIALTRRRAYGIVSLILFMLLFVAFTLPGTIERIVPCLSWLTAGGSLAVSAFVAWIYWRRLLRRYSTSDLNQPIGMIQVLVAP